MALVTKNDVTQIFAIQAPSIDLPPTFANYPRGWDTARSNNGKPTNITVVRPKIDRVRRNGISLTSGKNVFVDSPIVSNVTTIDGIAPTEPASSQLTVDFIKPMINTNYIVLAHAKYTSSPDEQVDTIWESSLV